MSLLFKGVIQSAFKAVSDAIKLNDLDEPFVKIEINGDNKESGNLNQTCLAVNEIKKEGKFIAELHKHKDEKGSDCVILPFACEIATDKENKTMIFFQKKYTGGDGNNLKTAPLFQKMHVLKNVAEGLAFVHKLGFVHMDMKPANFLIEGDVEGQIPAKGKVSDFGLTVKSGSAIHGGTLLYLAPEALHVNQTGFYFNHKCLVKDKIDSFALGITILEVLRGTTLTCVLGAMNQQGIEKEIAQYTPAFSFSKKEKDASKDLLNVARQLLKYDPLTRISCAEAAQKLGDICLKLQSSW